MIRVSVAAGTHDMTAPCLDVLIIGAGFSGICAGIKLRQRGITRFEIHEKASGVGGTWWENTYPGATCDIPSHFYCFSFEPNPDWSRLYAPQPEIQAYIEHCADTYGVRSHIHLNSKVLSLRFDEETARWEARFDNGESRVARFVINGSGTLHKPSTAPIEGAEKFPGEQMHSARWDPTFDPAGKRIAMIGSAASAIQIVPEIARFAEAVHVFQRTPNYIFPRGDFAYSDNQKRWFRRFPGLMRLVRWKMVLEREIGVFRIVNNERMRRRLGRRVKARVSRKVKDASFHEALTPNYELGCKRILISDDFYDALNRDNVELVQEPIARITETGIATVDGTERAVDAIVYATGFDLVSHWLAIDVKGQGGATLADVWKQGVTAYRGVMIPDFPNYFMVTGPNTGVGTTSMVHMIEQSIGWIMQCIDLAGDDGLVSVTQEACDGYNDRIQKALDQSVWSTGCDSWYRNPNGRIETLYPWNGLAYARQMRSVDRRDLRIDRPT